MKTPPHNLENEQAVLGCLLLSEKAILQVADNIDAETFYYAKHQVIYKAIEALYYKNEPIDLVTVATKLREHDNLEAAGGLLYLNELQSNVHSTVNLLQYVRIIKEAKIKRHLLLQLQESTELCYKDSTDVFELLDGVNNAVYSLTEDTMQHNYVGMDKAMYNTLQRLSEGVRIGLMTGFVELDDKINGLQGGQLVIIAARPSMGKTAFALNIAANINKSLGFISLEMSEMSLVMRLLAMESGVTTTELKSGTYTSDVSKSQRLAVAIPKITESPIYITDNPFMTIQDVRTVAKRMKHERKITALFIDYLQLIHPSKKHHSREQEVREVSNGLKAIAKELDIPVIALSQLNRSAENRLEKRPMLSDLRESGSIEQDADIVMLLHRPEYYGITHTETGAPTDGLAEIIVAKNRDGEVGTTNLRFIKHLTKFTNLFEAESYGNDRETQTF